jgi:hypothetical protein
MATSWTSMGKTASWSIASSRTFNFIRRVSPFADPSLTNGVIVRRAKPVTTSAVRIGGVRARRDRARA